MSRDVKRDCVCPRVKHRHGTWHAYATDDCGCPPCTEAWRRYCAQLRKRRYLCGGSMFVSPVGVARRLQALATNGWGAIDVARELGLSKFVVEQWRIGKSSGVTHRTHARIADLYDRVWDQPSPSRYAKKVRNIAEREGWAPPLAWDPEAIDDPAGRPQYGKQRDTPGDIDEIAVSEAMSGRRVHLTPTERREAVRRLTAYGLSATEIADRLDIERRSIVRLRISDDEAAA